MQLFQVMRRTVWSIEADDSVQQAAEQMRTHNIGGLPVYQDHHLVGFVTDRDITVRATAAGCDPATTPVSDVMSSGAVTCYDDDDVSEATRRMCDQHIRRILVLNRSDRLVGTVSLDDLAVRGGDAKMGGMLLERLAAVA
jgi:CBS domain-containing protein